MFIERYFACGIHLTPSLASTGRQSYLGNYNLNNFRFSVNVGIIFHPHFFLLL